MESYTIWWRESWRVHCTCRFLDNNNASYLPYCLMTHFPLTFVFIVSMPIATKPSFSIKSPKITEKKPNPNIINSLILLNCARVPKSMDQWNAKLELHQQQYQHISNSHSDQRFVRFCLYFPFRTHFTNLVMNLKFLCADIVSIMIQYSLLIPRNIYISDAWSLHNVMLPNMRLKFPIHFRIWYYGESGTCQIPFAFLY